MIDTLPGTEPLSAAELDRRLEKAVHDHERSEKLICIYLTQLNRRRLYNQFGFENIYDYALERFGFCRSKTRALLYLGRRLSRLPALTEALARGRIGWTKAAKVASVATSQTDREWTEKAVTSSYRDLERQLRDELRPRGGNVKIYLTAEQAAIWDQALEICRRVSGEEIDTGLALEYIAGEFLATYQASAESVNVSNADDEDDSGVDASQRLSEDVAAEIDEAQEARLCPDRERDAGAGALPMVEAEPYAAVHRRVLDRDGFRCQYPGCSVRAGLHVHHIEPRSRFGSKARETRDAPGNLVTLCWFHHRMLHAELIGLHGRAPGSLCWRRPAVMETATERHQRLTDLDTDEDADAEVPNVWHFEKNGSAYGDGVEGFAM